VLPLDEDGVAARVAVGELMPLTIDGKVSVRPEMLAQLRAGETEGEGTAWAVRAGISLTS
jgi:hypothetical protein